MKKALAILITVCLLASLFVSCDNNARIDELVSVSFDALDTRALEVNNEAFIDINDPSLVWEYMATKVSDPKYNVGAASTWTPIPGNTPGKITNVVEFSQGKWNFELRAVTKDAAGNITCVIYYGKTDIATPVLLTKQSGGAKYYIPINLSAQLSGQNGYIVLSNIRVKHLSNGIETFDAPSKVFIDGSLLTSDKYTSTETAISTTSDGLEYGVGTHLVKVQKIGANGEVLAEEEKTVEVYAGLKTTVSNWIVEITQGGQFAPVAPTGTTTVSVPESEESMILTVANVSPSMTSGNGTSVTVPTSIFAEGTNSVTVKVSVKEATEASNSFTASSTSNTVAAVIDLTLLEDDTQKTDFGDSSVIVETYVAKNLADFSFGYPGEDGWTAVTSEDGVVSSKHYFYDSGSGRLVFRTSHFSSFVVETTSAAVIGNVAYDSLDDAISKAKSGETVTLINNKELNNYVLIIDGRSITLDMNGHDILCGGYAFHMYVFDDLLGGTLNIIGQGKITCDCEEENIFYLVGDNTPNDNSIHLIIGEDVTVISPFAVWVDRYPTTSNNAYGINVDIYGTLKGSEPIYVSGNIHASSENVPTIVIHDGATIDCMDFGIYLAGYAKTIIYDATITSNKNAISLAAGELYINGATITGGNEFSFDEGGGGSITFDESSAVFVKQHSTNLPIIVEVKSGSLSGALPFYQATGQKGDSAKPEDVSISITGGEFISTATEGDGKSVKSDDKSKFISGGTFSSDPSEYIGDFSFAHNNGNGTFTISSLSVDEDGTYLINNANDLVLFEKLVNERGNGFNGKTVKLANNIDLAGVNWKPIGTNADGENKFKGIFDGQGHTISNMTVDQDDDVKYRAAGFFGALNGTAKNIIFDNATVTSISAPNGEGNTDNGIAVVAGSIYTSGSIEGVIVRNSRVSGNRYVGGISGYTYGSVNNCTVENTTVTSTPDNLFKGSYDNGDKAGGVVGAFWHESSYAISGNTVNNVTVKGYRDIGGIVGYANGNVTGNTVNGLTLIQDYSVITTPKTTVEAVIGRHDGFVVDASNTANNVTVVRVSEVSNNEKLNQAISAANKGDTVTINVLDDVTLDNGIANEGDNSRNITFIGNGSQSVDVITNAVSAEGGQLNYQRGSSFTFENLTIEAGEGSFDGIVCDELTFKNCTIKGKLTLYGKATFINCTFENTMEDQYSIWTWGGTDVTFQGCTFNTNGKAILLYGKASGSNPTNLVVKSCTFNDRKSGAAGKAAIEIGNDYNATYTLTVNGATVNGFAAGKNTGSKLWANKNSMDLAHLSVTVDGEKVYGN